MENKRERLGSRLGFILLSAGCAIGCGNVWGFPYKTGANGGGGFVLIYLICLLLLGLPIMTMEFSLGRASQASPLYMLPKLKGESGKKWGFYGWIAYIGNIALMAFYTVVAGWFFYYFFQYILGDTVNLSYESTKMNTGVNAGYMALVVALGFGILSFNLQKGLEAVTKYMMIALFLLLIILGVHSLTLPGAAEGMKFYLIPDFSKINGQVIVTAMNQSFFTLSLGIGSMAIFGSYIDKKKALMGESAIVISLDTFVALLAGVIIFPACFTYGQEVGAGPGLLFDTMNKVFGNMAGGRVWGILFFLFMIFAAMSTVLAVFENILAMTRELTGWSRRKGSIICAVVMFIIALTSAFGFKEINFHPFGEGTYFFDLWDFLVNTLLLPLGCVIVTIFCSFKIGWGWDGFVQEANTGKGLKIRPWMKPIFKYVVPVVTTAILIYGLVTYSWG